MGAVDLSAAMVLWNEAHRIERLVERLRPYVKAIAIGVQESTDGTLDLAHQLADAVVTDAHWGFGDKTFGPKVLPLVRTEWTFKVDGDEMPTIELLESLPAAIEQCERERRDGAWVRFRSWTEGVEWEQEHGHLRLFRTRLGWPSTLHSRPMTDNTIRWFDHGWIEHRRSLDEMIRDYLNYYQAGRGNRGWDEHNTLMMREACQGAAAHRGWEYVKSYPWWPQVLDVAFGGGDPQ